MNGNGFSMRCQLLGTIVLILLQTTRAIINETFNGYLFTIPDESDADINRMSQGRAYQWCRSNQNSLLEIYNSQLQGIVTQFISGKSGSNSYLGNREIFTNGMRNSIGTWMWINGQNYIQVGEQGVLNQGSSDYGYGYLVLNHTGVLYIADNLPANKRVYICENMVTSTCTGGFEHGNRCYTRSTEQLSWFDARSRCLGGGGDLASFDFVNNTQSLNSLNGSWINPSTQYWIGLRRQWWSWQRSGPEIKYTNWQDGHPFDPLSSSQSPQSTSNCLCLMSPQRNWSECDCNQNYQFICLRAVNGVGSSTLTTAPSSYITTSVSRPTVASISSSFGDGSSTSKSSTARGNVTSDTSQPHDSSLEIGLGVGLGVGLSLLIIIIIIVVVVLIRKRRQRSSDYAQNQKQLQTPDILKRPTKQEEEEKYATVPRNFVNTETKLEESKTIYAEFQPTNN